MARVAENFRLTCPGPSGKIRTAVVLNVPHEGQGGLCRFEQKPFLPLVRSSSR